MHKLAIERPASQSVLPASVEIYDETRQRVPKFHVFREVPLSIEKVLRKGQALAETGKAIERLNLSVEVIDEFAQGSQNFSHIYLAQRPNRNEVSIFVRFWLVPGEKVTAMPGIEGRSEAFPD